jgi:hypothetical protein
MHAKVIVKRNAACNYKLQTTSKQAVTEACLRYLAVNSYSVISRYYCSLQPGYFAATKYL